MNWTEQQIADLYANRGLKSPDFASVATDKVPRPKAPPKLKPLEGRVSEKIILFGYCPSKKNLWKRGAGSTMYLDEAVTKQIDTLTAQVVLHWNHLGRPVEHPEITVQFFIADSRKGFRNLKATDTKPERCIEVSVPTGRRDRDGMLVTVLDCLQQGGVLVNDDIDHCNARLVIEPCEFVKPEKERVEIIIQKN